MNSTINNNANPFSIKQHPASEMTLENKVTYLYGIGLILSGDNMLNKSEQRFINALLEALGLPDDSFEEVDEELNFIDESFLAELKSTLLANNLLNTFFYDLVMISFQGSSDHQRDKTLIKGLVSGLEFSGDLALIEKTIQALNSKDKTTLDHIKAYGYWNWKHLIEYSGIEYEPQIISVSNQKDLDELIIFQQRSSSVKLSSLFSGHCIELTVGKFELSEAGFEILADFEVIGAGINKTIIWLTGNVNSFFDEDCSWDDHSHEIDVSIDGPVSNCSFKTTHPKLLVLTHSGKEGFKLCDFEGIIVKNSVAHMFEALNSALELVSKPADWLTKLDD